MLALVGTHYHFRRVVPVALRPLFGKTEFWISLKTGNKSEARLSAMALHARTSALFRTAHTMTDPARNKPITKDDLLALYEDIIKRQEEVIETTERNAAEQLKIERYTASMTRYEDLLKTRAFLTYSTDALERLNQHIITLRQDMITGKMQDMDLNAEVERAQEFDLTKRNPRRAWTDDDLALLSSSAWTYSTIWLPLIAV